MYYGFGAEVKYARWEHDGVLYWYHVSTAYHAPLILYVIGAVSLVVGFVCIFIPGVGWGVSAACFKFGIGMIAGTAVSDVVIQEVSKALTGGTLYRVDIVTNTAMSISIAYTLRNSVATYYKVLQEVALVALLCVLSYVAIRMILSVTARRKSKI